MAWYSVIRSCVTLMVTTENGTRYQVNPDRSVTPVDAETAIAISPDDAHVVVRADEETLGFYYVWPMGYTPGAHKADR